MTETIPAAPPIPDSPFEIIEQRDIKVRARDGTPLATNLYLPGRGGVLAPGRFPAIVRRTPYGKDFTPRRRHDL